MSHRIELPDSTYDKLLRTAAQLGATPAEWIASQLSHTEPVTLKPDSPKGSDEVSGANARLRATRLTGYSSSLDNSVIDKDLLLAYETPGRYGDVTE